MFSGMVRAVVGFPLAIMMALAINPPAAVAAPVETIVLAPDGSGAGPFFRPRTSFEYTDPIAFQPFTTASVRSVRISGRIDSDNPDWPFIGLGIAVSTPDGLITELNAPFGYGLLQTPFEVIDLRFDVPVNVGNSGAWSAYFFDPYAYADRPLCRWAPGLTIVLDDEPLIPATTPDLGTISAGVTVVDVPVPAAGFGWVQFSLPDFGNSGVDYVDIDTELNPGQDTFLFASGQDGSDQTWDWDSGSGSLAQLSFGAGARCGPGDGDALRGSPWRFSSPLHLGVSFGRPRMNTRPISVANVAGSGGIVRVRFTAGRITPTTPLPTASFAGITATPPVLAERTIEVPPNGIGWCELELTEEMWARNGGRFMDLAAVASNGVIPFMLLFDVQTGRVVDSARSDDPAVPAAFAYGRGLPGDVRGRGWCPAGRYLLAVMDGPWTAAAQPFLICQDQSPTAPARPGGIVTLRLTTGTRPLYVPPAIDLGTINGRFSATVSRSVVPGEKLVARFTLASDVAADDFYLDIDGIGTDAPPMNSHFIGLFDTSGQALLDANAQSPWAIGHGAYEWAAQLSFGNAPARPGPEFGRAFANQTSGTLQAGTYYVIAACGNGGGSIYPWEFILLQSPPGTGTLTLNIRAGGGAVTLPCTADIDRDGTVDGTDFVDFINSFALGDAAADAAADVTGGTDPASTSGGPDGTIDGADFIAFINSYAAGC